MKKLNALLEILGNYIIICRLLEIRQIWDKKNKKMQNNS
jgi:hypothetical protein